MRALRRVGRRGDVDRFGRDADIVGRQNIAGALAIGVAGSECDVTLQAGDVAVDLRAAIARVIVLRAVVASEALGVGNHHLADRLVVAVVVVGDAVLTALNGQVAGGIEAGVAGGGDVAGG